MSTTLRHNAKVRKGGGFSIRSRSDIVKEASPFVRGDG
jgi:hypothetical protein